MEVTELRIKNLVQLTDQWYVDNHMLYNTPKIVMVDDISKEHLADNSYYVAGYNLSDLEPIPLSEEWIMKLGFKKNGDNFYDSDNSIMIEGRHQLENSFWLSMGYDTCRENTTTWHIISMVKYVHQLQNLYISLMEEELQMQ